MSDLEIVWTKVDEAPGLATYSLLPIVSAFVATAGVKMKLADISLTPQPLRQEIALPLSAAETTAFTSP